MLCRAVSFLRYGTIALSVVLANGFMARVNEFEGGDAVGVRAALERCSEIQERVRAYGEVVGRFGFCPFPDAGFLLEMVSACRPVSK